MAQPRARRQPAAVFTGRDPSAERGGRARAHRCADEVNPALGTFFLLAATTGARRGELLALRWRDVDLDGASLSFQRSLVDGANGPVLAPTKTRRSHQVALDALTTSALVALREQAGVGDVDLDRFVFSSRDDGLRPWLPNWVTKAVIRCRRMTEFVQTLQVLEVQAAVAL